MNNLSKEEPNQLNYFGTSLTSAGHYFWVLNENHMKSSELWFRHLPFNPENLPIKAKKKGEVQFHSCDGYSICAIEGSCIDKRGGSKSVFFVKGVLTAKELTERIKALPIAMKIIQQMPFTVDIFKP